MKVKDLISVMLNCELVIINCDNVRVFAGTVYDLNRQKKHLDDTIIEICIMADSLVINTTKSYKDSLLVCKKGV